MRFVLALVCLVVATSSVTGEEEKRYITAGAGGVSCAQFAEYYAKNPTDFERHFFTWAQGFMSGLNVAQYGEAARTGKTRQFRNLASKSVEGQMAYIRTYCDEHPLAGYDQAVSKLFMTLPFSE